MSGHGIVTRSDAALRRSVYCVVMKTQMGTAQPDSVTDSTTIEVMLTPQQMKALSRASGVGAMQQHKSRILIGAAIAVVLVVLGSVAHLAAKPKPIPAPVIQAPPPAPPPPPEELPAAAAEPVLFKNPFDRTEVFEFPAGTTQQEARDAVATLLMDRAHGRGPDVLKLKIRKVRNSKQLTPATTTQSARSGPLVSSSGQTASPPADHR
jgi:hypothetical protein